MNETHPHPVIAKFDESCATEPIPANIARHYRKAAHEIGDLFCWCVQNLEKFPPIEGDWLDIVKARLRRLAEVERERDGWKKQHDAVLSQARKDNLRAEDADRYEQWLLRLGEISGCWHVDDRLPRCVEEEFESTREELATIKAENERLLERVKELEGRKG